MSGDVEEYDVGEKQALRVFKAVNVVFEGRMVTLEVSRASSSLYVCIRVSLRNKIVQVILLLSTKVDPWPE